jgi:hypothetical protein
VTESNQGHTILLLLWACWNHPFYERGEENQRKEWVHRGGFELQASFQFREPLREKVLDRAGLPCELFLLADRKQSSIESITLAARNLLNDNFVILVIIDDHDSCWKGRFRFWWSHKIPESFLLMRPVTIMRLMMVGMKIGTNVLTITTEVTTTQVIGMTAQVTTAPIMKICPRFLGPRCPTFSLFLDKAASVSLSRAFQSVTPLFDTSLFILHIYNL